MSKTLNEMLNPKQIDFMLYDDRRIMHSNMIYIGDGLTDVPCMQLTKDHGGVSIAVYTDESKSVSKICNHVSIGYLNIVYPIKNITS